MIIRQFLHQEPVGISYLFGCGGRATAAVVDPVGPIEPCHRAAEGAGMRIHFVIDTHVHADHLSTGRQLAKAAGAEYVLAAPRTFVSIPASARPRGTSAWQRRGDRVAYAGPHTGTYLHPCE